MKKLFFFIPVMILCYFIMTGQKSPEAEKWNQPMSTSLYDPNMTYNSKLPLVFDYFNPNSVTRYIKTPNGVVSVTPNVRVLPRSNSWQSELNIVRHPLNPLIIFGSSNAFNNVSGSLFISEGVYVSTNGGVSWYGSDTLTGQPLGNHGGDPGPTIDKNGVFINSHLGFTSSGMFANYSTDNGLTWSPTATIIGGSQDKNLSGTDDAPSSPYYGRSYTVWSLFSVSSPPIDISYTTNSGQSWSTPIQINTSAAGHYSQGCDIRVGPNGEVYVCWAAPTSGSPFTEDFCGFGKSTNGGVNWTVTDNAFDMNGVRGTFSNKSGIRVNSFPRIDVDRSGGPRNGWIYIVTSGRNIAPAGSDPDILLYRSSNGGANWSSGVRVNQDAMNNGKYQWFPCIRVDEAGGVNIVYYDDRNTASDSSEIYLSRSLDGGNTWSDVLVSDHRFKPKPITVGGIAGGYQGDYIGVTSGNGKLWPLWMDDITGVYQAWTSAVQIQTFPLNAFNLTSPAAGSRIATLPNNTTTYTFNWDTSASTASYKWIFGSPSTTPRKITLQPNGNHLDITGGQLDAILAGLGLNQGDSLVGQWDVWAFRNNQANDSMKATNGPRAITLKRAKPLLTPFNLSTPPNNSTILTLVSNTGTNVNMNWTKSGEAVTYKWAYASPNFTNPTNVKFRVTSNNSGFDSLLTLRNSRLDSMLAGIGVNVGDSSVGQWRVYGYSASDSLASTQTFNLTLRRGIPPTVTTSVDSMIVNLPVGQTTSRNLIIGNTGQFSLTWDISESSTSGDILQQKSEFTEEQIYQMANLPKGAPDIYHGSIQTDSMGGPDAGGYRWIDSDSPGGPVFNWVDISTTGTEITTWTSGTADDGSVIVPLPFSFAYYGTNYSQFKICTNGWAGFDISSTSNAYSNTAIPSTLEPNNALYVFWDDMDLRTSGHVYYKSEPGNNRFIVEWKDVPHYSTGGPYTYQIILYSDGRIYYQYQSLLDPINSNTIGTENVGGATGLQIIFDNNYVHNNMAIKIEKGLAWVDEVPNSGTITPGGNQNVSVNFNAIGLTIGSYTGILKVNSNDPLRPVKEIGLRLNVGAVGINNNLTGIPTEFELSQNYPNPFNPTTVINYQLPENNYVTLKVYDLLGREVMTLVNEQKQAGFYNVEFNATNFASGIYFYTIKAGDFKETKRMLLVK